MTQDVITAPDFILALRDQLVARLAADSEFSAVKVFLVEPSSDLPDQDRIVLISGEILEQQEYVHPNREMNAAVEWPGYLRTFSAAPDDQVGEGEAFKAAMNRAAAIVREIARELAASWPEVGKQTRTARVSQVGHKPIVMADGGWGCHTEYVVSYSARVQG